MWHRLQAVGMEFKARGAFKPLDQVLVLHRLEYAIDGVLGRRRRFGSHLSTDVTKM